MQLLREQCAVVTGGAGGIGRAIAAEFVAQGANVVIADLDAEAAVEAARVLATAGVGVISARCDVSGEADIEAVVARCVSEFGRIDVMVNNAGITRDASIGKMTLADFRAVVDVHLQGAWLGTKYAAAQMRQSGRGSIINISSTSGKAGMFGQTNYSAAKAGIIGLTKAAAKELAPKNIRVNAVQPGLIRTPMTERMPADIWDAKMADIPLGRAGEPAEVATVVSFLASTMASYLTGAVIEVSGGRLM